VQQNAPNAPAVKATKTDFDGHRAGGCNQPVPRIVDVRHRRNMICVNRMRRARDLSSIATLPRCVL
jgi:hypothetical protein